MVEFVLYRSIHHKSIVLANVVCAQTFVRQFLNYFQEKQAVGAETILVELL